MRRVGASALLVFAAGLGRAQFSPGPLSKAHHRLNGPARCTACHSLAAGERAFRCLNCHTDIRERLAERRGLHATYVKRVGNQQVCIRCHSEHNGENFVPIRWDMDLSEFDHAETGYLLEGRHRGLDCRRCHTPAHITEPERRKLVVKDLKRTYLGLSRECAACHADEHRGQLSADCSQCHTLSGWRPASGFDHSRARFLLTGAHQRTACEKCHLRTAGDSPYVRYTGIPFASCSPCHDDPHRGSFSVPCQECHTEETWKPARLSSLFDHTRTEFPLEGNHRDVGCNKCHLSADFKAPVAHALCLDCHRDQHQGQFLARADGGDCGPCHNEAGWKPSLFRVAEHQQARYPLKGRHAEVACAKCHIPAGKATRYRVAFDRCLDCHVDPHHREFAGPPHEDRCEACHTLEGFTPSTFSLVRHEQTRWPLAGAHLAVPCGECHRSLPGSAGKWRFRLSDRSCTRCHEDPHGAAFAKLMAKAGAGGRAAGCEACHNLRRWADVSRFDHASTSFPLEGVHRGAACGDCHRPAGGGPPGKNVRFGSAPSRCSGCHEDIHGGQFATADGTDCERCHTALRWKPSVFDHDRNSNFPLTGAHKGVRCSLCHTTQKRVAGKLVLVYRPTPKECSDCHGAQTAG